MDTPDQDPYILLVLLTSCSHCQKLMDRIRSQGTTTPRLWVLYNETTETMYQKFGISTSLLAFPHAAHVHGTTATTLSLAAFEKYVFEGQQLPAQVQETDQSLPTAKDFPS